MQSSFAAPPSDNLRNSNAAGPARAGATAGTGRATAWLLSGVRPPASLQLDSSTSRRTSLKRLLLIAGACAGLLAGAPAYAQFAVSAAVEYFTWTEDTSPI